MNVETVSDTVDQLGESCVWSFAENALYWVDVRGRKLRRHDSAKERTDSYDLPELTGSIALREKGGVIVAMQTCIGLYDLQQRQVQPLVSPEDPIPNQRFNDGRCDRQGRFFAGTMDDVGRGEIASLYRLDANRALMSVLGPVTIPNSLAWSPDGTRMYFSDTTSLTISVYDFDTEAGIPAQPREFARTQAPAAPDGSTVDAEGCLWNAEYNGWKVTRYAPDGRVDRVIKLPIQRPTCCALGGPDLTTLFVTSASQQLSENERAEQPLAGRVLAIEVDVPGLPEPCYRD